MLVETVCLSECIGVNLSESNLALVVRPSRRSASTVFAFYSLYNFVGFHQTTRLTRYLLFEFI